MNVLSRIDAIARPFFAKTSEMFRNLSDKVSEPISNDSEATSTKPLPNPIPNNPPPVDGRKKVRSQKQIETYKKTFKNRHNPSTPTKTIQQPTIHDTVMEVQRVLLEITALLQSQEESPPQLKHTKPVAHNEPCDEMESDEDIPDDQEASTIYDNLFD